jgi:hypothetical protein
MAACGRGVLDKRRPRLPMPASAHGMRHGADRTGGGDAPRCAAAASPGLACAAVCAAGGHAARRDVPVAACVSGRRRARQRWRRRAACRGCAAPCGAGPRLTPSPAALLPRASIWTRGRERPGPRAAVKVRGAQRREREAAQRRASVMRMRPVPTRRWGVGPRHGANSGGGNELRFRPAGGVKNIVYEN